MISLVEKFFEKVFVFNSFVEREWKNEIEQLKNWFIERTPIGYRKNSALTVNDHSLGKNEH